MSFSSKSLENDDHQIDETNDEPLDPRIHVNFKQKKFCSNLNNILFIHRLN